MLVHDCTRQVEVLSFIECQQPSVNSGWFLDYFFRDRRTTAEKLEVRKYSKGAANPLLYTGACLPPPLIKAGAESLTLTELSFPTIKAETKITGCDVDERRILPDGTLLPVGLDRFNEALNWGMMGLIDGLRATHISEAITLLKTGGYILHSSDTDNLGTVDFGRDAALANIDLSGTADDFGSQCARPFSVIENIGREMARCGGIGGGFDIVYGETAWRMIEAHDERDAVKFDANPAFYQSISPNGPALFTNYNDVQFKGVTNGGSIRHWVSFAQYLDHTGTLQPVVAPGQILIVARGAFDGQRVFRTITSDNKEFLPDAAAPYFIYDDLEREYNRKCRSFSPWLEEYHLLVPGNVNGAALVQVTDDATEVCVPCEECI